MTDDLNDITRESMKDTYIGENVSVKCRHFSTCQYRASGSQDFVRTNYKQHLREHHALAHPRVEPEELVTYDAQHLPVYPQRSPVQA